MRRSPFESRPAPPVLVPIQINPVPTLATPVNFIAPGVGGRQSLPYKKRPAILIAFVSRPDLLMWSFEEKAIQLLVIRWENSAPSL